MKRVGIVCHFEPFLRVNLPRWGLKLDVWLYAKLVKKSVNLPRWGLKPSSSNCRIVFMPGVNLPRWGLKRQELKGAISCHLCKFTPLGFETWRRSVGRESIGCVNLPRWGLKQTCWGI